MKSLISILVLSSTCFAADDTWLDAGHIDRKSELRPYVDIWTGVQAFTKDDDELDYSYYQTGNDGDGDQAADLDVLLTKPNELKAKSTSEASTYETYDGTADEYQLVAKLDLHNRVHAHSSQSGPSATARSRASAWITEDYLCWSTGDEVATGTIRFQLTVDNITNANTWWMSGLVLTGRFGQTTVTYTYNSAADQWSYTINGVRVVDGEEEAWNVASTNLPNPGLEEIHNVSHPMSELCEQGETINCYASVNPYTSDLLNNYLYTTRSTQHVGPDKQARVYIGCEVALDSN